ncbi:MAG TPA: DUF1572 family protein [Candidatus Angelobacter sp.]|nr:DUF1572 family protein [Candidatus Angelobacter sp.]
MTDLAFNAGLNFSRYYQRVAGQVHDLVAPLSDDHVWSRPYPYGNSIGHLLLHITGNLNYYVGAQIAQNGYVRNRDLEFTDSSRKPKQELLKAFDDAFVMVQATIAQQSDSDWSLPYSAKGEEDAGDRFTIFLRCAAHAYHHVGQVIYLREELMRRQGQGA